MMAQVSASSTSMSRLDHDFNNTWGIILSATETEDRPISDMLFREYRNDPVSAERGYSKTLCQYTDMFEYVARDINIA